jgi:hypothetical protein
LGGDLFNEVCFTPVDLGGLDRHVVDLIRIILSPLIYPVH